MQKNLPENFIKEIGSVCRKYKIRATEKELIDLFESLNKRISKSEVEETKKPDSNKKKIGSIQFKHLKDDNS